MFRVHSNRRFMSACRKHLLVFLLFEMFAGSLIAQDDDLKKPFEAFVNSMNWAKVLSRDHDVTATVHLGENEDAPTANTSVEVVCKSRQIFDSQSGEFWIPYARGSFELRFNATSVSPNDRRAVGFFVGDRVSAKEFSLNGQPTRQIRNSIDVMSASNPIDLVYVATNPYAFSLKSMDTYASHFHVIISRLESLEKGQLIVADERLDNRAVKVYRIKAEPVPKSISIPTNKIVVANEGPDKGLVLEFMQGGMKLGNKDPYENEGQLLGDYSKLHRVYWKELEIESSNKVKKKVVVPVSISKKSKRPHGSDYMNVSFEWNGFARPAKELRSDDAAEKIAKEFDQQANKILNR